MKNTHEMIQTNFHSITSAAGALNVPVATLRAAKKAGADGFRANGNIDLLEFVRWLLTRGKDFKPGKSLEESKALLAEAQAKRIEREAAIERGELCEVAKQKRALYLTTWTWFVTIQEACRQVSAKIDPQNQPQLFEALREGFQDLLINCAAAGCARLHLPPWAVEAIRQGAETRFTDDGGEGFKTRMELLGGILAGRTAEQIEEKLAAQ